MATYPNDQGNPAGAIPTYSGYNTQATYSVQVYDVTPVATATDFLVLTGSSTKTVYVHQLQVSMDAATGSGSQDLYVFKRGVADTGGTFTVPAIAQYDSAKASPTATVALYSANPTINDAGVLLTGDHVGYGSPSAVSPPPWVEYFNVMGSGPVVLRGIAQQLCLGFNGDAIASGLSVYARIVWSEL